MQINYRYIRVQLLFREEGIVFTRRTINTEKEIQMNSYQTKFMVAVLGAVFAPVLASADSTTYAWADVVEAEPVTRIVRQPVETEVCWQEEVYREIPERRSKAPQIVGAILGGIIGNQFGGGSGQDAMTLAGATLGHAIAKDSQRRANPQKFYASLEDRCGVNTEWKESRVVLGWDVTYEYQGVTYLTRMAQEPGDQIKVQVNIEPVQG
jgi:uncharacterized protein YcfJ